MSAAYPPLPAPEGEPYKAEIPFRTYDLVNDYTPGLPPGWVVQTGSPWDGAEPIPTSPRPFIPGVSPSAPTVVNENGARQSDSPYRVDLLPARATLEVARVRKGGASKYGENNWRGLSHGDHLNHALVHLFAHLAGDVSDDHLAHAACRLLFALELSLTVPQTAGPVPANP